MIDVTALKPILDLINSFGVIVCFLAFGWMLYTERIVPGSVHKKVVDQRDFLLMIVGRQTGVTERAVEHAEHMTTTVEKIGP